MYFYLPGGQQELRVPARTTRHALPETGEVGGWELVEMVSEGDEVINNELSILNFVLGYGRWFLELTTSPMCDFQRRAKSVGPIRAVFTWRKT